MAARPSQAPTFSIERRSHVVIMALKVLYIGCGPEWQDLLIAVTTVSMGIFGCCQLASQAPNEGSPLDKVLRDHYLMRSVNLKEMR